MIKIEKIMAQLETDYIGREIHYFQKLSSTNTIAKEQAERGAKEGTTVIAETQTEGKGRLNRPWVSPKGGVWLSIILRPAIAIDEALKITLTIAVAVATTIHKLFGLKAEIKWPNDILINNKKVCGILTEATLKGKTVNFIVVGVGINANFSKEALPEDLRTIATTLKEELKKNIDREKLVCGLLKELEDRYKLFKEHAYERLLKEWRGISGFLGRKVEIASFEEKFQGTAVDVDENGALIVELENGTRKKIISGDVTVRQV